MPARETRLANHALLLDAAGGFGINSRANTPCHDGFNGISGAMFLGAMIDLGG